jgi:hypothetical protein
VQVHPDELTISNSVLIHLGLLGDVTVNTLRLRRGRPPGAEAPLLHHIKLEIEVVLRLRWAPDVLGSCWRS